MYVSLDATAPSKREVQYGETDCDHVNPIPHLWVRAKEQHREVGAKLLEDFVATLTTPRARASADAPRLQKMPLRVHLRPLMGGTPVMKVCAVFAFVIFALSTRHLDRGSDEQMRNKEYRSLPRSAPLPRRVLSGHPLGPRSVERCLDSGSVEWIWFDPVISK